MVLLNYFSKLAFLSSSQWSTCNPLTPKKQAKSVANTEVGLTPCFTFCLPFLDPVTSFFYQTLTPGCSQWHANTLHGTKRLQLVCGCVSVWKGKLVASWSCRIVNALYNFRQFMKKDGKAEWHKWCGEKKICYHFPPNSIFYSSSLRTKKYSYE